MDLYTNWMLPTQGSFVSNRSVEKLFKRHVSEPRTTHDTYVFGVNFRSSIASLLSFFATKRHKPLVSYPEATEIRFSWYRDQWQPSKSPAMSWHHGGSWWRLDTTKNMTFVKSACN